MSTVQISSVRTLDLDVFGPALKTESRGFDPEDRRFPALFDNKSEFRSQSTKLFLKNLKLRVFQN